MKKSSHIISMFILFALPLIGVSSAKAQQATRPVQLNASILQRLERSSNSFRESLNVALIHGRINEMLPQNDINTFEPAFSIAIDEFRYEFMYREAGAADVQNLLRKAWLINRFMIRNRLNAAVQNDWAQVRTDLNALANAYGVTWQWNRTLPAVNSSRVFRPSNSELNQVMRRIEASNSRLTGTFKLDSSRSDDPYAVAEQATRTLSNNERQSLHDRMFPRLESPELLAIERRGSTMTMASSRAQQSTFEADGVERQEQLNGRSSRVTATLSEVQLDVKSIGYRDSDFDVTFESIENGGKLRVRRQIYPGRLNQPVVVNSVYDRTSDAPRWNIYEGLGPGNTDPNTGRFIMRDGETVVAVLTNHLSTRQAQPGDRFTMAVRDGAYQGAVIEGTVASVNQGGRLSGRSGMSLDFDTIRLSNGQTYRFAGVLTGVHMLTGATVKVDNEGGVQRDNQTTQTLERAGIGTAIGVIIGAVAGGGKGAAIGGVVGAASGAGSVYVTGKDNLELPSGTELTVRSSVPGR